MVENASRSVELEKTPGALGTIKKESGSMKDEK
jgi:hypothetical protein